MSNCLDPDHACKQRRQASLCIHVYADLHEPSLLTEALSVLKSCVRDHRACSFLMHVQLA